MLQWIDTLIDIVAFMTLIGGLALLLVVSVVLFLVGLWPLGLLFFFLFLGCIYSLRDWMY
ncbi:membrane protein [Arthrobacter phage Atuin]|nr:membrane protein [Arthrobacter phage Atuin]